MDRTRQQYPDHGVTLVELVITVAIAAILLTVGVAGFQRLIADNRMSTAVNGFVANLQLARSEAMKRGTDVVLCPSSDGSTCLASTDWHRGRIVAEGANVIWRVPGDTDTRVSITSTAGRTSVTFGQDGSCPNNVTVTFCDVTGTVDGRAVVLSDVGRHRIDTGDCSATP